MDRFTAEKMTRRGEAAIRELVSIMEVDRVQEQLTSDEFDAIKRVIGLTLGTIDFELLKPVYEQYPELDPIPK
ncbi:MAG: hypothetical protein JO053_05685 [Acidobacteria bacterium]|nr:hypothetical protein [Acidobacteriota bacterium]